MKKHHISAADELFFGEGKKSESINGRRGVPITPISKVNLGSPAALSATGIAAAQAVGGAVNLTINGSLASGGVATNAVPRGVSVVSANVADTSQTATFYGTDVYGVPVVETLTLNGTTTVAGKKAFKTITRVAMSATTAGTVSAGVTDILGLPYKLTAKSDLISTWFNQIVEATLPTIVVADTNTATATTGDVRGTIDLHSALNGSAVSVYMVAYPSSEESTFGVAQYGG